VPIIVASKRLIPKSIGAKIKIPMISKLAGIKHNKTAGRPIFNKSLISRLSPALSKDYNQSNLPYFT
jgi:hypothetical protein